MNLPPENEFLRHIAYDSVVFGFSESKLKVLILEYHNTGYFALPGGFVRREEDLDEAVIRGLEERTGISNVYLNQFYTFGNRKRYQPEVMATILNGLDIEFQPDHWLLDRFISIAYLALIRYDHVELKPDLLADSLSWYDLDEIPDLILDHNIIIDKALQRLKKLLYIEPIGKNLLPWQFTMKDLQKVYEAILGHPLARTAFHRKILSLDMLDRHEKLYTGRSHKAPYLYSFKAHLVR